MMAANLFLDIALWAWVYRRVGAIPDLEANLYFRPLRLRLSDTAISRLQDAGNY